MLRKLKMKISKLEKKVMKQSRLLRGKGRIREITFISMLILVMVSVLLYSNLRITGNAVLDSASVIVGRDNYSVGDTAHIFIAPKGIDYEIEIYGPNQKLYAVSTDFPLERPGKYTIKAVMKDNGVTRELMSQFDVQPPIEETTGLPDSILGNSTAAEITGSLIDDLENATADEDEEEEIKEDIEEIIEDAVRKVETVREESEVPIETQTAQAINDTIKDAQGQDIGRKIDDDPEFETFFDFAGIIDGDFIARFKHDSTTAQPVWVEWENGGEPRYLLSELAASGNETVTLIVPLIGGRIPEFRLHVGIESEVFEFGYWAMMDAEEQALEEDMAGGEEIDNETGPDRPGLGPGDQGNAPAALLGMIGKNKDIEFTEDDMTEESITEGLLKKTKITTIEKEGIKMVIRGAGKDDIRNAWFRKGILHIDSVPITEAIIRLPMPKGILRSPKLYIREDTTPCISKSTYDCFTEAKPYKEYNKVTIKDGMYTFSVEHFSDYWVNSSHYLSLQSCLIGINNTADSCSITPSNYSETFTYDDRGINSTNAEFDKTDLVLAYDFDIVDSEIFDSSGYERNGSIVNAVTAGGYYGGAYFFNSSALAYSQMDLNTLNLTNYSMTFWMNYSLSNTTYQAIFDGTALFVIMSGDDLHLYDGVGGNATHCGYVGVNGIANIPVNEWHFITINRYSNKTVDFYYDGKYNSNCISVANSSKLSATSKLGARVGVTTQNFNGTIDQFRIYNKTLSDSEISRAYTTGINRFYLLNGVSTDRIVFLEDNIDIDFSGSWIELQGANADNVFVLNNQSTISDVNLSIGLHGRGFSTAVPINDLIIEDVYLDGNSGLSTNKPFYFTGNVTTFTLNNFYKSGSHSGSAYSIYNLNATNVTGDSAVGFGVTNNNIINITIRNSSISFTSAEIMDNVTIINSVVSIGSDNLSNLFFNDSKVSLYASSDMENITAVNNCTILGSLGVLSNTNIDINDSYLTSSGSTFTTNGICTDVNFININVLGTLSIQGNNTYFYNVNTTDENSYITFDGGYNNTMIQVHASASDTNTIPIYFEGNADNNTLTDFYLTGNYTLLSIGDNADNNHILSGNITGGAEALYDCVELASDSNNLRNITFRDCGNTSAKINEDYRAHYSPLFYDGVAYNNTVFFVWNAGAGTAAVTANNTKISGATGTNNWRLILYQEDTSSYLACGAYCNATLYVDDSYTYSCAWIETNLGGKCYEWGEALIPTGANLNYTWNTSITGIQAANSSTASRGYGVYPPVLYYRNLSYEYQVYYPIDIDGVYNNISENTFLISDRTIFNAVNVSGTGNKLWFNNFYSGGANTVTAGSENLFCYGGEGNFYEENVDISLINQLGDCGSANFTLPLNGSQKSNVSSNNLNITWKKQDSTAAINYTVHYSNDSGANWHFINATTNLSLLWDLLVQPDMNTYMLRLIPNDGSHNGTWTNVSFVIDKVKPYVYLNLPSDDHNQSSRSIELTFNSTDIFSPTMNCSLYLKSLYNQTNSTISNSTASTFNLSGLQDNDYWYNITCWDIAGNVNSSDNRTYRIDATPPTVHSINATPYEDDKVDTSTPINVTMNITDLHQIDAAVMQYKRGVEVTWTNLTMTYNLTSNVSNASFTTDSHSGVYTIRVMTNDSLGNINVSHTYNISSYDDYTWNLTPSDFGTTSSLLSSSAGIGNLTVNNTGDDVMTFDLTDNSPYGLIYNDTEPFSLIAKEVRFISVNATFAPSVREDSFNITATASATSTTSPLSSLISASIITYAGGPYLSVIVKSYKAAVVHSESGFLLSASVKNLGNETATNTRLNWTLPGGWIVASGNQSQNISNLTSGSTATNNITITINATAAESATKTISVNGSCDTCTAAYDTASITVSCNSTDTYCGANCTASTDLECAVAAVPFTVTPSSTGGGGGGGSSAGVGTPMSTGKVVESPTEKVDLVRGTRKEFPISITNTYEGATLENIKVNIAGYLLQYVQLKENIDYTKQVFVETKPVSISKVGQDSEFKLGTVTHKIRASRIIGKSVEFIITSDPVNITLEENQTKWLDLNHDNRSDMAAELRSLDVGKNSTKIDVNIYRLGPPDPDKLMYMEQREYMLNISAPAYLKFGNHTLDLTITADIVKISKDNDTIVQSFLDKRKIILAIQEASSEETNESLSEAESAIMEMKALGFSTTKASKMLERARSIFTSGNYRYAKDITKEILDLKNIAIQTNEMMGQLNSSIASAEQNGLKVIETKKLMNLAIVAFGREDYRTAQQRIKDAQLTFALETKGKFNVVNFIMKNFAEITITLVALVFVIIILYGRLRAVLILNKLRYLDKEELAIKDLIKNVQVECFERNKLSVLEFHKMMYEYNKRLEKIRHKRIELRSKRIGLLRMSNELKSLQNENDYLLKLMRQVQKDYFEEKTADWETYTSKMEALSERRAEVEKSLAMLSAKEILEKRKKELRSSAKKDLPKEYVVEAETGEAQKQFSQMVQREEAPKADAGKKSYIKSLFGRKEKDAVKGIREYADKKSDAAKSRTQSMKEERELKEMEKEMKEMEKDRKILGAIPKNSKK